ncbi:MAG TPA: VOC family protein [Gemmatimonadaceae bacterium]|jgi:catechol 2,3-dioxygenase-like lactoylglutathione lyase family enzyme|nr:VOC family protein [Gemmatimonadaceae bacterium]
MLGNKDATATVPVKNLEKAKQFYEGTLGLTPVDDEGEDAIVYQSGNTRLLVYKSAFAGTNKATVATWGVGDDIEKEVKTLQDKGVAFEHYADMPEVTLKGDVHVMGDMKAAWFKDPDGNIHAMVSR